MSRLSRNWRTSQNRYTTVMTNPHVVHSFHYFQHHLRRKVNLFFWMCEISWFVLHTAEPPDGNIDLVKSPCSNFPVFPQSDGPLSAVPVTVFTIFQLKVRPQVFDKQRWTWGGYFSVFWQDSDVFTVVRNSACPVGWRKWDINLKVDTARTWQWPLLSTVWLWGEEMNMFILNMKYWLWEKSSRRLKISTRRVTHGTVLS